MEQNINYIKPAIYSLMIGLAFASFSQSCSTTRASISKLIITPVDPVKMAYSEHKMEFNTGHALNPANPLIIDSGLLRGSALVKSDTVNYNKLILDNQQISLLNEKKILDLLLTKEKENKRLKNENIDLSKKSKISEDVKNDAVSMQAIWDMGYKVLTVGCGIIVILLVQVLTMIFIFRKRNKISS